MRVGLVTIGEPLPTEGENVRLYRTGMLAQELDRAGHEVVWWTSGFDHFKRRFFDGPPVESVWERTQIRKLKSRGYSRNISWRRYRDHLDLAKSLTEDLPQAPRPDVFLCSIPVAEHAEQVLKFAQPHQIPVVLDARDMWPDLFLEYVGVPWLPLAKLALNRAFRSTENAFKRATGLMAHTDHFLEWALEYAGRPMQFHDRVFPFGYHEVPPADEELARARANWDQQGILAGPTRVLYSGQLIDQVNMLPVWAAARANPQVEFLICGDGQSRRKFEQQALGIPNVRFTGWIGLPDLRVLMERSHAGLMPYVPRYSFMCSVPNKANEYMANRLPLIWSMPAGELTDLIAERNIGVTYSAKEPNALAAYIGDLHAAPDAWRQRGENGFALFRERFRAEDIYPAIVRYLEELASKRYP
ncbi:MAG: glycosyltransferase [Chthonomonas sp.]|nr:glycosyltransferase [Chthonomonas sp.]